MALSTPVRLRGLLLTDNWLVLTVRFITEDRGMRDIEDAMSRDILRAFDESGLGLASATYEIVALPPLRIEDGRAPAPG